MRHKPNCAVFDPCPSECDCQKTDHELMREWQIKAEQKDREIEALRNHIAALGTIQVDRAEYEALRRDAERYRYALDHLRSWEFSVKNHYGAYNEKLTEEIDAAINMPNGEGNKE
jgi:hypothetical protein